MREKMGKLVVAGLFALGLILSPGADGYAQGNTKRNNNAWQQNQFWQQQRTKPQQYRQDQQRQLDQQRERERLAREAQAARRQREQAQLQRANDNPRPGTLGATPRPSSNVIYLKPTNSAKRATPPAAPSDASKLTPAQIKAGFKGQFANGKAIVTVGKKTFAINPNGITGKPKATLTASRTKPNVASIIKTRLTALKSNGLSSRGGGNEPPSGGKDGANSHSNDNSLEYLPIKWKNYIKNIPKRRKPDPISYLSSGYIKLERSQYDLGASFVIHKESYRLYSSKDGGKLGRDDGLFIMPKQQMDNFLKQTQGRDRVFENAIGFQEGDFDRKNYVRIDIPAHKLNNWRIPSGNEEGADKYKWEPAGRLPGGGHEAIIDPIKSGDYYLSDIE